LVLAVAYDCCGMFHAGVACLLIDATIVIGCGLLMALFVPLLAGLNALLGALDGDARRCFPVAAPGRLNLSHLSAGGMRCGDMAPSFDNPSGDIDRHVERS
jgi:hypothetical protein